MPIRITCTDCCSELSFPDDVAGQQVRCPRCDAELVAPGRVALRPADNVRGPAPVRQERVRATRPAQADEEPVRPKRPAGTAEERVHAKRPASTAEGQVRAKRPSDPDGDSDVDSDVDLEAEAPKAGREPGKKKRKRKQKSEPARPPLFWWLVGGSGVVILLLVGGVVVVVLVAMKPDTGGSRKARSAEGPDDGWADVKTATQLAGPDPERVANMMEIYAMGGECKFSKGAEPAVVSLRLHSPHASDGMMNVIRGFSKLKHLDISQSRVTDFGLQHLYGMPELDDVNLKNTLVTGEGVITLHKTRPKLKIDY